MEIMRVELPGANSVPPSVRRSTPGPASAMPADTYSTSLSVGGSTNEQHVRMRMLQFGLPLVPTPAGSEELKASLTSHGLGDSWPDLREAYDFAKRAHEGQNRDDGTPYYHHCARVAILAVTKFGVRDVNTLKAALLHDVVEDTPFGLSDIRAKFGPEVADLTDLLTKPSLAPGQSYSERNEAYLKRIEKSVHAGVLAIKLADRLDNIDDTHLMPRRDKIARYLNDTEEHYIPLAQRRFPEIGQELQGKTATLRRWLSSL